MSNEQGRPDPPSKAAQDAKTDQALQETFPGSDAPANTPPEGTRKADQMAAKAAASGEHATGGPTSDREATERAAAKQ